MIFSWTWLRYELRHGHPSTGWGMQSIDSCTISSAGWTKWGWGTAGKNFNLGPEEVTLLLLVKFDSQSACQGSLSSFWEPLDIAQGLSSTAAWLPLDHISYWDLTLAHWIWKHENGLIEMGSKTFTFILSRVKRWPQTVFVFSVAKLCFNWTVNKITNFFNQNFCQAKGDEWCNFLFI